MSMLQPTLAEAEQQVASVERMLAAAIEAEPYAWRVARPAYGRERIEADGFWIRFPRHRHGFSIHWPVSDVMAKCDDCQCYLRASRDAGGDGFGYNPRWLTGNPAERDPTVGTYADRYVCMPCLNRVRPKIARAQQINEIRLMIGRIKRETTRAA